jgi:hypothetical protein
MKLYSIADYGTDLKFFVVRQLMNYVSDYQLTDISHGCNSTFTNQRDVLCALCIAVYLYLEFIETARTRNVALKYTATQCRNFCSCTSDGLRFYVSLIDSLLFVSCSFHDVCGTG